MASVTRVMLRVSRLPGTVRRWTGMAGLPRLAAIRKIAWSEDAQGISPVSSARRAASQPIVASGWPVLMLVPALMMRRKAVVREVLETDDQLDGGGAGQDAVCGIQKLADQFLDGNRDRVHDDASGEEEDGRR